MLAVILGLFVHAIDTWSLRFFLASEGGPEFKTVLGYVRFLSMNPTQIAPPAAMATLPALVILAENARKELVPSSSPL